MYKYAFTQEDELLTNLTSSIRIDFLICQVIPIRRQQNDLYLQVFESSCYLSGQLKFKVVIFNVFS